MDAESCARKASQLEKWHHRSSSSGQVDSQHHHCCRANGYGGRGEKKRRDDCGGWFLKMWSASCPNFLRQLPHPKWPYTLITQSLIVIVFCRCWLFLKTYLWWLIWNISKGKWNVDTSSPFDNVFFPSFPIILFLTVNLCVSETKNTNKNYKIIWWHYFGILILCFSWMMCVFSLKNKIQLF